MLKSKIQNPKSKINSNPKCQISKQRFCYLEFVLCHYFVICALLFVILMSGCATIIESAKGITGISTKVLEDNRKYAIIRTFNYDYNSCYNKTKEILIHTGSYIYAQNLKKKMLAIYVSKEDTTPVGLFFKEVDADNTQVEVSSPSTYAKELIAGRVFSALGKSPKGQEQKGQSDEKESESMPYNQTN